MRFTYVNNSLSFFKFIRFTLGLYTVHLLKKWIHNNKDLIKTKARNKYLLNCKRSNLVPKHLLKYVAHNLQFFNHYTGRRATFYSLRFIRSILNLEISDNFKRIKGLTSEIYRLSRAVENNMPIYLCNQFFYTQQLSLSKLREKEKIRYNKKLVWNSHKGLSFVHNASFNKIKNINYICSYDCSKTQQDLAVFRRGSNNSTPACSNNNFSIDLDPQKYDDTPRMLLEPREKWFVNSSNTSIPADVIGLLQLGEGFCLPPDNESNLLIEFIKHTENGLRRLRQGHSCINTMRSQFVSFLKPVGKLKTHRSDIDRKIIEAVWKTKRFKKEHPNIIFTKADKGNAVVALDRDEYVRNMESSLSDPDTYTLLKHNPANKVLLELKTILKRWNDRGYIALATYSSLNTSNAILPRAYGLPKIHKTGHPLRIIISSVGSPLHNLANFLHKILVNSLPPHFSQIRNSSQLIEKLSNIHIPSECCLASFDVVSLFTNVPTDMVLEIIKEKWCHIQLHTNLPQQEFVLAIKFVLESTFFLFNNRIYKQTFGAPMGSPLSPVVADLILQKLEASIFNDLTYKPIFYHRYVDDIALSVPTNQLNDLLSKFNSFHRRLNFTMEMECGGDRLNFLDLTIIKRDNTLIFDWFRKPTFSGRFLNYFSHHPFTHKRGTMYSLIDRVFRLSHPSFHKNNFDLIIKILLDNGYPLDLIFNTIRRRLHAYIRSNKRTASKKNEENPRLPYFTIPYVSCIFEKFTQFFKTITFGKLAFSCYNKLNKFIRVHKDALSLSSRSNVVYRINCLDCDASYVGQTKRTLNTRIMEHKNHIRRNSIQHSVITDHKRKSGHEFDWDNVKILDSESNYNKRLISEMIYIKKQKHGLNAHTDTALLDPIYNDLLGENL